MTDDINELKRRAREQAQSISPLQFAAAEKRKGHDGMTWQERRSFKKRHAAIEALFFMTCEVHGAHVPIHPYDEGCFYCVEKITIAEMNDD